MRCWPIRTSATPCSPRRRSCTSTCWTRTRTRPSTSSARLTAGRSPGCSPCWSCRRRGICSCWPGFPGRLPRTTRCFCTCRRRIRGIRPTSSIPRRAACCTQHWRPGTPRLTPSSRRWSSAPLPRMCRTAACSSIRPPSARNIWRCTMTTVSGRANGCWPRRTRSACCWRSRTARSRAIST